MRVIEAEDALTPAILIAVRDREVQDALASHLRNEGYALLTAADGETVLRLARQSPLQLMLLDRSLPPHDGFDLCRLLREQIETAWLPILMIAMQEDETDIVVGLEVGADDFITWPCRWHVLHARIRALLRRSRYMPGQPIPPREQPRVEVQRREQEHVLTRGDMRIDLAGRAVTHHDRRVDLSARLFNLLVYLARHQGMVLSRKQLIEQVCQNDEGVERLVDVYVHWLRERLEDDPAHPQYIQTVRGIGYRFRGE